MTTTAPHPRTHGVTAVDLTVARSPGCTSSCPDGEGHADEWFRVDQASWGSDRTVNLSAEPTGADAVGVQQPFAVSLQQQACAPEPRILIGGNDLAGQALTLHEARRFAYEVLALVDRGREQGWDSSLKRPAPEMIPVRRTSSGART